MVEFHKHIKDYINNNYSVQYYDKSYYTDSGELIAEPSTHLNELLNIDVTDLDTRGGNKIVCFNLKPFTQNLESVYVTNFIEKILSDKNIKNSNVRIILFYKKTPYDFKHNVENHPNTNFPMYVSFEDVIRNSVDRLGVGFTKFIFISDNIYMTKNFYSSKIHLISHTLDEIDYVNSNRNQLSDITKYIDNINKLSNITVNIKNIDTPYNFILFKYLVESGNLDNVFLKNTNIDTYNYSEIKSIFDRGMKWCKAIRYTHLEKYLNFTIDDYNSLIEISKNIKETRDANIYDNSLFTVVYNIIDHSSVYTLSNDIFDSIHHHHPLLLISPPEFITLYNKMGYRRSFFMYRDVLLDSQDTEKSIPHYLNDLDKIFNSDLTELRNTIISNKDIMEYNNNFLYNLTGNYYLLTKIAARLISSAQGISLGDVLVETFKNKNTTLI